MFRTTVISTLGLIASLALIASGCDENSVTSNRDEQVQSVDILDVTQLSDDALVTELSDRLDLPEGVSLQDIQSCLDNSGGNDQKGVDNEPMDNNDAVGDISSPVHPSKRECRDGDNYWQQQSTGNKVHWVCTGGKYTWDCQCNATSCWQNGGGACK